MVIGIVAGTYSSIYVAAPLTEYIDRRMRTQGEEAEEREEEAKHGRSPEYLTSPREGEVAALGSARAAGGG